MQFLKVAVSILVAAQAATANILTTHETSLRLQQNNIDLGIEHPASLIPVKGNRFNRVALISKDPVKALIYKQTTNHFGKSTGGLNSTFDQYAWVNSAHYAPGGPLILLVGGEGPASQDDVRYGLHLDMAQKYGGAIVTLEHRFYGQSLPSSDPASLWLLTVEQALLDFKNFADTFEIKTDAGHQISKGSKWIAFGGSYSGSLAAWLRLEYPDTFWAAHAASAPVWAEELFVQYQQSVYTAIPQIGGSQACADGLTKTHMAMDTILTSRNKKKIAALKDQFGLSSVTDDRDFASYVTGLAAGSAQYGPTSDNIGNQTVIATLCNGTAIASQTAKPAEKIANLAEIVKAYLVSNKVDLTTLNSNTPFDIGNAWVWQVCTEFGYLQIANPHGRTFYSKLVNDKYFQWQCKNLLGNVKVIDHNTGKEVKHTRPDTSAINRRYLSLAVPNHANRILFSDGLVDPWHQLSVFQQKDHNQDFIRNHFGYHCDEFSSSNRTLAWRGELIQVWDGLMKFAPKA